MEDNNTSFEHLKIILNNVAKDISRAMREKETIEFVKNNAKINLVLMDVKMPIIDGYNWPRKKFASSIKM